MLPRARALPVAALLSSLALVGSAGPVGAGSASSTDATGDSAAAADLVALDVRHAEEPAPRRVVVRAHHTGLPSFSSGTFTTITFWVDVDGADPGPEYVAEVVPNAGGMSLRRISYWGRPAGRVDCPGLRARADVFNERPVTLSVPRPCLDLPPRVRAAVRSVGRTARGDRVGVDWVGGRRHWSRWVRR